MYDCIYQRCEFVYNTTETFEIMRSSKANCLKTMHVENMRAISKGHDGIMMKYWSACVTSQLQLTSRNCEKVAETATKKCAGMGMYIVKEYMDMRKALFDKFVAKTDQ